MENGTFFSHFYLSVFQDQGYFKYVFFILTLTLYFVIIFFNVIIVVVIILNKALHEPMYIFIFSLSINSLYGTVGFYPRFLNDLLSLIHTISRPACFIQTFVIYTYSISEFTILTAMAYDRHVAICKPLLYSSIMTSKTTATMIGAACIYPIICLIVIILITSRLPLCGNEISRVYCANWSIVKLSCITTTLSKIVGSFFSATTVFLPLGCILYSYMKILTVCRKNSKEFKKKALQTCLAHLITFVNYSITMCCEVTISRLEPGNKLHALSIILSLEFLIIPPVLNPLVYGLNLPEMRKRILNLFKKQKMTLASY